MSGVIARMILTGGFALIVAAITYFSVKAEENNRQHAHSNNRGGSGGGRRPRPDRDPDPPKNSWNDSDDGPRPRRSSSTQHPRSSTRAASKSKDFSCTICLLEFSELLDAGAELCSTKCGHVFCRKCITQHISTSDPPPQCPICRERISIHGLSRVFLT